jgi:hypothetical protein
MAARQPRAPTQSYGWALPEPPARFLDWRKWFDQQAIRDQAEQNVRQRLKAVRPKHFGEPSAANTQPSRLCAGLGPPPKKTAG